MYTFFQKQPVVEKHDLMIAASPLTEFVFMVTHDSGKLDAVEDARYYDTLTNLEKRIADICSNYDIRIISVYGQPKEYVDKVAQKIETFLPDFNVNKIYS